MIKNVNKFRLAYFMTYMGDALFSPFIALYFISLGFSDFQRSILLMIIPLGSVLGNLLYGKLSGNFRRNLLLVKILALANMLVIIPFGLIKNFYILLVLTFLFSLHNNPAFSFGDGIAVKICEKENKLYSSVRYFGSLGYFIILLAGGYLIDLIEGKIGYTPFNYIFIIAGLFFLITLILYLFITPFETIEEKQTKISYKTLFKSKAFIKYLIFYFIVMGIWTVGESYASTYYNDLGVSAGIWSYMFAGQVGLEIIVLVLCSKLVKNEKTNIYILYAAVTLVFLRFIVMGLPLNVVALIVLGPSLRGIGWGLYLSSHLPIVKRILGPDLAVKGITLLSIGINLLAALGVLIGPLIYQNISYRGMYLLFGIIQVFGSLILLFISPKKEIYKEEKIND